jgi:hypothetical protein
MAKKLLAKVYGHNPYKSDKPLEMYDIPVKAIGKNLHIHKDKFHYGLWSITHIRTGMAVCWIDLKWNEIKPLFEEIDSIDIWDFGEHGKSPTSEKVKEIAQTVMKVFHNGVYTASGTRVTRPTQVEPYRHQNSQ